MALKPPNNWTLKVHTYLLQTGKGMSPAQIADHFGPPTCASSPSSVLNSAMRNGWFRREEWQEMGAGGLLVRKSRYFALDRTVEAPAAHVPRRPTTSYFTGLKRVRSIFELAETLE